MNKNLFRLVFNAARGQVMAVSEAASSHCRSQSNTSAGEHGASCVLASNWHPSMMDTAQAAIKSIVTAAVIVCAPAWLSSAVWAQTAPATTVVVNTAAPAAQQPTVTTTSSGVTQVNIQTSVGGVSRNRYTQFDVGSPGLILNNSAANSNTQLGGWVQGNTNLASGSAAIILNEVNSANPSQLRGYIEVAGQRAEVVIANPAGISVNGGGFINASGATLTTGTPQFSGNSLTGYQVNGGTINVTGTGLDTATTGITTLQARQIILQGAVHAQDLRVTADNTGGTANAVAIDVAAIGGMYANKITILATGQGAGVNNAGTLQANSGSFTLSADGTLTNTGTINSTATTRINADTVNNSSASAKGGSIYGGSVAIAATTLNNTAANSTDTPPAIAARDSTGRVDIGVTTLNNQEGALIYSAGVLAIGGDLNAAGQATGRATTVTNNSATIEATGNMRITSATLANTYTSLSYRREVDPTTPATTGSADCGVDCWHTWVDTYYRAVAIAGPHGPAVIRSGADMVLDASSSATNSSSQILAAGTLTTSGAALDTHGIDLTTQVATHRDHTVVRTWMENGIGCPLNCHSQRRWSTTTSTDLIARNQTIGPAISEQRSTTSSTTALPNSALFAASNNNRYLVETNPAFTNKQIWLSSDAMLAALSVDPDTVQKRMGDGFYEQRLINEQVAQLTGYRRLANYTSDEQQYQALMNAGVTFALAHQLRPGIALTAEQVASLTSDIVWLETREVTVPGRNGEPATVQKVLVPQVYAVARAGDLATDGTMLSGNVVKLNTSGDITNSHASIQGRELVSLNATNVRNLAGRIEGKAVSLNASQDIQNIGGAVIAQTSLSATAGRDIKVQTTTLDSRSATPSQAAAPAGSGALLGGMLVSVGAAGTSGGNLKTQSTDISRVAGLYVTGDAGTLLASAGRDVDLVGALLQSQGSTTVAAGGTLNLATVTTRASMDATMDADNYNRSSKSAEVGSTLQSTGNTTLTAGQDIQARAADVQAAGNLTVTAGSNVVIESGIATSSVSSARKTNNSGFLSSSTRTERSSTSSTQAIASNFGGKNVTVASGPLRQAQGDRGDIRITASNVVADQDLTLAAAGKVSIEAGTNTQTQTSYSALSESGLMSSGGLDVSIGTRDQSTDQKNTRTSAAASTVGSTGSNVTITAGTSYTQTGSDVVVPAGNVTITAQKVDITSAAQNSSSQTDTEFKQSGITLSISNPVLAAAQTINSMGKAIEKAKDGRMQALALASAGAAGYNAADAVQKQGSVKDATAADKMGGININLSLGSSSSESHSTSQATTQRGSSVHAGGNVNIKATGSATDSDTHNGDITVGGSTIQAGNTVTLDAQNKLNLVSTQNTTQDRSSNSSSSGSVGVGYSSTAGLNVNASASESSGRSNGSSVTQNNTLIQGQQIALKSGSDTTVAGAVVRADQVSANVGGNLLVESRQDTDTYQNRSSNSGGSISVGTQGGSGSISFGKSNTDSTYASVTQQSGIRSGDGGFDITVQGKTRLVGGVISTTEAGVKAGNNKISSAGGIETQDIHNSASYTAESSQVSIGTSAGSSSAGFGQDSGTAASTTKAGISGIAGNTAARTGDAETGIQKIFNQQAVAENVNAQVQITQTAGQQVPKATATAMDKQAAELQAQAHAAAKAGNKEQAEQLSAEAAKYKEGGAYRIAAHTLFGALSGGVGGAAAAGTVAYNAQNLNELQAELTKTLTNAGVGEKTAKAIANVTFNAGAMAAGNAVGGNAGETAALNVDANNRQLHPDEEKWIKANAKAFAKKQGISEEEAAKRLTQQALKDVDYLWRAQLADGDDMAAQSFLDQTKQSFTNDLGQSQKLFTTEGQQLFRPEMFAETADPAFYKRFAQSGISRDLSSGLIKEFKDSGISLKNGMVDVAKAVKENPGLALNAVWNAIKAMPGAVVDGFIDTGHALGEGAAVATNEELSKKLNAIYGTDVTAAQRFMLAVRLTTAVTGAAGTAKAASAVGNAGEQVAKAAGKQLDKILDEKTLQALLRSGGALDELGKPLLDMSALTTEQKRVIGEQLFGPNTVQKIVPDGQQLARMQGAGTNGIDELYKVSRPDVDYVNVEYKFVGDPKVAEIDPMNPKTMSDMGSDRLGKTKDGLQGSQTWIGGSNRIEKAVGVDQSRDVYNSLRAGRVESWVVTIRPDGSTAVEVLDAVGKPKPINASQIIIPNLKLSGARK